jgi:DNA-binding transcriptional MerR regulator
MQNRHDAWLPRQFRPLTSERRYRIGDVARLLNETPVTLRWWEVEFAQWLKLEHSKSGQRVYTSQTFSTMAEIQRLLRVELYTAAGAKRQLRLASERAKETA